MAAFTPSPKNQVLLDAQLELWHHTFSYVKSMALKSALDLRIADAIHHHGGAATLAQIAAEIALHRSKLPYLARLMRVLTVTGIFSSGCEGDGERVYGLTPASRLLVGGGGSPNVGPFLTLILDTVFVSPFLGLGDWLVHRRHQEGDGDLPPPNDHPTPTTLFKTTHGQNLWDFTARHGKFAELFDSGMVADTNFCMDIVIKECGWDVFGGISGSLVDVAGGLGGASQAITKAFPHVRCSVLELPHVVAAAPVGTGVEYVAGDMFQSVPSADAVFLKWVLHDWGDAECVKILRNCRKAIPPRRDGGKVIIFDMVVGAGTTFESADDAKNKHREMEVLFDLFIMFIDGAERDEQGWKKIFFEAGFTDYRIIPVLGLRSIIEVYP